MKVFLIKNLLHVENPCITIISTWNIFLFIINFFVKMFPSNFLNIFLAFYFLYFSVFFPSLHSAESAQKLFIFKNISPPYLSPNTFQRWCLQAIRNKFIPNSCRLFFLVWTYLYFAQTVLDLIHHEPLLRLLRNQSHCFLNSMWTN